MRTRAQVPSDSDEKSSIVAMCYGLWCHRTQEAVSVIAGVVCWQHSSGRLMLVLYRMIFMIARDFIGSGCDGW